MNNKTTFCIQRGYTGREVIAIASTADSVGAVTVWRNAPEPGEIPIGTVEFCQPAFGDHDRDFYPEFLQDWLHREVRRMGGGELASERFVKDASAWKSDFISGIRPAGFILPLGDWWVIEPVEFVQEWRYYIAGGHVRTTGWYAGHDEDEPAPELGIEFPLGFSGAVDFGRLSDGRIALVEAHAPFACGWYGEHHKDYASWQMGAWYHGQYFWKRKSA